MKWQQQFDRQQQARQLRAIEIATARQAGIQPRKLRWYERWALGIKK